MLEASLHSGDITSAAGGRIAVLPTGSTEYHGPHGYLGVDSLIARELARRVAQSLDGILLPSVDYAWCPEMHRPYPGTISIPQEVMQDFFAALLDGVLSWGVSGVLIICGHNGNLGPMAVAADHIGDRFPRQFVLVVNWWETWPAEESGQRFGFTENGGHGHGGPLEMSAAWAVHPKGVHPQAGEDISVADVEHHPTLRVLHRDGPYPQWNGNHGRVSQLDRAAGLELINQAVERIVVMTRQYIGSRM